MIERVASQSLRRMASSVRFRYGTICLQHQIRLASTDQPAPALLPKLRNDLKAAMKAKDTNRLNVVRGILNEVASAAKTSSPMTTDMQLLSLLRKRTASAHTASREFQDAGRTDLKDKEDAQIAILDEYAGGVETMSDEDMRVVVSNAIHELKSKSTKVAMGDVLKRLLGSGGDFDGKAVERSEVSRAVKELLSSR